MPRATVKPLPHEDGNVKTFEFQGQTFEVRTRFKVGRFLKILNENPMDALELALTEDSNERFLDLEIDMDELKEFMGLLSEAISGATLGN